MKCSTGLPGAGGCDVRTMTSRARVARGVLGADRHQVAQQCERGIVGPMHVLDDEHRDPLAGCREQCARRAEEHREPSTVVFGVAGLGVRLPVERVQLRIERRERAGDREVRDTDIFLTGSEEQTHAACDRVRRELVEHARLTDTRLPDDDHDLRHAAARGLERVLQRL